MKKVLNLKIGHKVVLVAKDRCRAKRKKAPEKGVMLR